MSTGIQPSTANDAVTQEIGALMGRRRLPATRLAEELGWSYSYLSRRLRGQTLWSVGDLDAIAAFFRVAPVDLFGAYRRRPG